MPDKDSSQMPPLGRFPSFSKRHASFNSPREVPLPSPVLCQSDAPNPFFVSTTPPHSPPARPRSPAAASPPQRPHDDLTFTRRHRPHHSSHHPPPRSSNSRHISSAAPPPEIHSSSRPMSIPDSQSTCYSNTISSLLQNPTPAQRSTTWVDRNSSASLPLPSQVPFYALPRAQHRIPEAGPSVEKNPSSESVSSDAALRCPSLNGSSSSSSSGTSFDATPPISTPESEQPTKSSLPSLSDPTLLQRPISPFRAPQPPPEPSTHSPEYTAMRRFMAPQPRLHEEDDSSTPEPDPPTILEADAPDSQSSLSASNAPYAPFLSHAPAPPDCWLEIESTPSAYRLHVKLPGFTREGITLSTKRRRILHVVADKWENGGGHFERRISFGYDADLVQVRAEFDGSMLRITIPRRVVPVFSSRLS